MEKAALDWSNLGFGFMPTDVNLVVKFRNGQWGEPETSTRFELSLPIAATALHYGQAIFEGMKAFETGDGRAVLFRPDENADRMARGARKLLMEPPPKELFVDACRELVRLNARYLPPSDSGAALYIRPLLIGTSGLLGVRPSEDYDLVLFCTPVGPYFKGGMKPIRLRVEEEVHRAAPKGVGDVKAAGNYAAGMRAVARAKVDGYDNVVYLDAREGRYVDETGATNFYGVHDVDGTPTYVTPRSHSILASITNRSIMTLARDRGMVVQQRPVEVAELDRFSEAGCCGTAAVIAPVGSIDWRGRTIDYGTEAGPHTLALYSELTGIQRGLVEDRHGWLVSV